MTPEELARIAGDEDTRFVLFYPLCKAVYLALRAADDAGVGDIRIADLTSQLREADAFAGWDPSETLQRNLVQRAAEIVLAGPPPWAKYAEVTTNDKVIWPKQPKQDLRPLLREMERRAKAAR